MGTKKPQELNQQLNLEPGTKSSVSGTKLLTLVKQLTEKTSAFRNLSLLMLLLILVQ